MQTVLSFRIHTVIEGHSLALAHGLAPHEETPIPIVLLSEKQRESKSSAKGSWVLTKNGSGLVPQVGDEGLANVDLTDPAPIISSAWGLKRKEIWSTVPTPITEEKKPATEKDGQKSTPAKAKKQTKKKKPVATEPRKTTDTVYDEMSVLQFQIAWSTDRIRFDQLATGTLARLTQKKTQGDFDGYTDDELFLSIFEGGEWVICTNHPVSAMGAKTDPSEPKSLIEGPTYQFPLASGPEELNKVPLRFG